MEKFPLPLGAWDGLRYFIVALPEPSVNYKNHKHKDDDDNDDEDDDHDNEVDDMDTTTKYPRLFATE